MKQITLNQLHQVYGGYEGVDGAGNGFDVGFWKIMGLMTILIVGSTCCICSCVLCSRFLDNHPILPL